jgi:hypothetical protein
MGRQPGKNRTVRKIIGYSPEEAARLDKHFSRSACGTLSEYVRKLSLGQPIKVNYRNSSLDSMIDEFILLRKEMEKIREGLPGTTYDQMRLIPILEEVKKIINKIADHVCKNSHHQQYRQDAALP